MLTCHFLYCTKLTSFNDTFTRTKTKQASHILKQRRRSVRKIQSIGGGGGGASIVCEQSLATPILCLLRSRRRLCTQVYYPFASTHWSVHNSYMSKMCIQNITNIYAGFWIRACWSLRKIHKKLMHCQYYHFYSTHILSSYNTGSRFNAQKHGPNLWVRQWF